MDALRRIVVLAAVVGGPLADGQADAQWGWPVQDGFAYLGVGQCFDYLWRRPRYVSIHISSTDKTEIALQCFEWCGTMVQHLSRCMGVHVNTQGRCYMFDRDWVFADLSAAQSLYGSALDSWDVSDDYVGVHVAQATSSSSGKAEERSWMACYRRVPECSASPDCSALRRYPCELGKLANTCDMCLPRHQAAGNEVCLPDGSPPPILRLAVSAGVARESSSSFHAAPHYQAGFLGALYSMKHAWENAWPMLPIPLGQRQNFSIEFVGFSDNWTKVAPDKLNGTAQVEAGNLMPAISAMAGTTDTPLQEDWDLRETDPPAWPVHAVIGSEHSTDFEEQLAGVAKVYTVPILGYDWSDPRLTADNPYYIRTNKVALDPGFAIGALFKFLSYTRIFIFQQDDIKRIDKQIAGDNPHATFSFHGPPATCLGMVDAYADDPACMKQVLKAWERMRADDARIIAHEVGGSTVEFLLALATDLLGERTMYVQSGWKCNRIDFLPRIASYQSWGAHQLLELFYDFSGYREAANCKACINVALYGNWPDGTRSNRTHVAKWIFSSWAESYHLMFCPHLSNMAAVLECSYCDPRADEWVSPECIGLEQRFVSAFHRSACVEEVISYDTERYELFGRYSALLRPGQYGSNLTEDGLNATSELRRTGMPTSYLEAYEPGGYMWKLGLASSLQRPMSWTHADTDTQLMEVIDTDLAAIMGTDTVGLRAFGNERLGRVMDAFLTVLVGYNSFVRHGGDEDFYSEVWRKHLSKNVMDTAFFNFLREASFQGVEGHVEYQPNRERNIMYRMGQLRSPDPEGCFVVFDNRSSGEPTPLEGGLNGTVVLAEWNFLTVPERTGISAEITFVDTNSLGCNPFTNLTGKIAVVHRGSCMFATKTMNAQAAGAVALLITNHPGEVLDITMAGKDPNFQIPTFMTTRSAVEPVFSLLEDGSRVGATISSSRCTDTSFLYTFSRHNYEQTMLFNPGVKKLTVSSEALIFNSGNTTPPPDAPQLCGIGAWYSLSNRECVICEPGEYLPSNDANCLLCPGGSISNTIRSLSCRVCPIGTYSPEGSAECLVCPDGTVSDVVGASGCAPCRLGQYWSAGICSSCSKGRFQGNVGATGCENCAKGTFSSELESSACEECPFGTFQSSIGSTICEQCDIDSFQPQKGSHSCLPCHEVIPNSKAPGKGTITSDKCECALGDYLQRQASEDQGRCVRCLDGLDCPGGLDSETLECCEPPKQEQGVHAGKPPFPGGPLPFRVSCAHSAKCPAGRELGDCPPHAQGLACDVCEETYVYSEVDGRCEACEGQPLWPLVLFITAICLGLPFVMAYYAAVGTSVQSETKMTIIFTGTLSLNVLQVLAAFREISVNWPEPMRSIYAALQVLTFRVSFLKIGCIATNGPVASYLATVIVHPCFAVALTVIFLLFHVAPKRIRKPINSVKVANAQGLAVLVMYIAISLAAVLPWQCERNLDGTMSVVSYRSVICWQEGGSHTTLLVLSSLCILVYDVGFIALIAWVMYRYSANIMKPGGVQFIRFYRFLFNRFTSKHYYYALIYCLRNLLLALLPVLFANNVVIQILLISALISGSSLVQCWLQPWRSVAANYLDAASSVGLIMVLNGGMVVADLDKSTGVETVQGFFHAIVWTVLGAFVLVFVHSIVNMLIPPKPYGVFLSHHKLGAAVLARWFKLLISGWTTEKVFLDSDDLSELSSLFNTCSFRTKNIIVILTRETLRRIWCAGEIASAMRHHVKIVLVACGDYAPPTDSFIAGLESEWADQQKSMLAHLGVEISHIRDAYLSLRSMPTVDLNRVLCMQQQREAVRIAFEACQGLRGMGRHSLVAMGPWMSAFMSISSSSTPREILDVRKTSSGSQMLVVLGNDKNPEDTALTAVISMLLQKKVGTEVGVLSSKEPSDIDSLLEAALYLLLVLTRGVLENSRVAGAVAMGHKKSLETMSCNVDAGFEFPGPSWFSKMESGSVISAQDADYYDVSLNCIIRAYKELFTSLSLRFSPHASEFMQDAEVHEMAPRFKRMGEICHAPTTFSHDKPQGTTVSANEVIQERVARRSYLSRSGSMESVISSKSTKSVNSEKCEKSTKNVKSEKIVKSEKSSKSSKDVAYCLDDDSAPQSEHNRPSQLLAPGSEFRGGQGGQHLTQP